MSHFIDAQRLEIYPLQRSDGKHIWVVSRKFGFVFGGYFEGNTPACIWVPEGFETDLGSIPAAMRWLINPSDPQYAPAYVLHDWTNHMTDRRPPGPNIFSSNLACAVFYEALRCNGVPVWMARMQASGVELGIASKER